MIKILLVEDNRMNREMLSRRLEKRGYDIEVALDGESAVNLAQTLLPDLILERFAKPSNVPSTFSPKARIRSAITSLAAKSS